MSDQPRYRRVLLKISGEGLMGDQDFGLEPNAMERIALEIQAVQKSGVEICLVIGGGNIFRGLSGVAAGLERSSADHMGMLATVINALVLQSILEKHDVPTRVLSAIPMTTVCEPYIRRRALNHLANGRVVVFAGGTGNPYFTTDTTAALRAAEIGAEIVLKATKVDGIYDTDPITNSNAVRFSQLTYLEVLQRGLKIMDATAISLCMENQLPIVVFDLKQPGSIRAILTGKRIGTLVTGE